MASSSGVQLKETALKIAAQELPVYPHREKFIRLLDENQTLVIVGETGSGKTTQIPQWCHEYLIAKGEPLSKLCVACTQPRRIAAMSVSARVAKEMGVTLGQEVGYSVRFDSLTSPRTSLKYLTDGMLLREAMIDKNLMQYNIIILDEAHERTLQTEILFGVVKHALIERNSTHLSNLKIIIMSATLNVKSFKNFFDNSVLLRIAGRQYPIQNYYACSKQRDMLIATLIAVFQLHRKCDKGDILVFCTGQDEIHSLVSLTKRILKEAPENLTNLIPMPLYAALPTKQQMDIFETQQSNETSRRVIYSTNVAETSITVPNIRYVIDTGLVKTKIYCAQTGIESLKITPISKSQATQRSGRAGRIGPGSCYRLYTQEDYENMASDPKPEIQRCNLDGVLLQLIAMGIKDIESFYFLEKPDETRLQKSLKQLVDLKAVTKTAISTNGNGIMTNGYGPSSPKKTNLMTNGHGPTIKYHYQLTRLGEKISAFPLSPSMAKVLVVASDLGCLDEAITIISLIYIENLFNILPNQRKKADTMVDKFRTNEGDLIMFLKVYRAFKIVKRNNKKNVRQWCMEHFINTKNLQMACYVRKQLSLICRSLNIDPSSCGRDTALVRKAFTHGFVNNIANMWNGKYKNKYDIEVEIHPSSCLFKSKPECLMYVDLTETNKCYMKNCSVIESEWIREAHLWNGDRMVIR